MGLGLRYSKIENPSWQQITRSIWPHCKRTLNPTLTSQPRWPWNQLSGYWQTEKKSNGRPLLWKDMKILEQVERLPKFVLWSDQIVKSALGAQPYAELAWSGVSVLLPH